MPRRVQDIVPNERRAIRESAPKRVEPTSRTEKIRQQKLDAGEDVPIRRVRSSAPTEAPRTPTLSLAKTPPVTRPPRKRKNVRPSLILVILGAVIVVSGIAFFTSTSFARATFTLTPKSKTVAVDRTYTFSAGPSGTGPTYQLVTLTDTATTSVVATTGAPIQTKAQGTVTIYNAYSAQAQRLVAGSRLSDNSGLIYRLASSVVVPGYKASNGANLPGIATVSIVADQPGSQYNISRDGSISDFKFVSYLNSPRYTTIYARLASEVTGGFSGAKKIIAPTVIASTTDTLKAKLTASLLERIRSTIPTGYIMYPTGYTATFGTANVSGGSAYTANLALQGTIYGIIFKQSDLVSVLAGTQTAQSFAPYGYTQTGLEDLSLNIVNSKDFSPTKKSVLIAGFKGSITLTGDIPVAALKQKFAGMSLDNMNTVLKPYDAVIETGSGELSPPWAHVPTDLSRISVVIKGK